MTVRLICIALYAILAIIWIILLLAGSKRYGKMLEPLSAGEFPFRGLIPVGFIILDMIRYSYGSRQDRKRLEQAKIVYGERYGVYYFRVNVAEKAAYISLGVVLAPLCAALFGNPGFCLIGFFVSGILYYYADSRITDVMKRRDEELVRDFPDMISKIALLINAGMITREAWREVARTGKGTVYDEMGKAVEDMANGMSEIDAYIGFGNRCGSATTKKFSSMLSQTLSKGNKELVNFLKNESEVSWEEKKHLVRRKGEEANNKMMIPLAMILIGVLLMILVPILGNMGF